MPPPPAVTSVVRVTVRAVPSGESIVYVEGGVVPVTCPPAMACGIATDGATPDHQSGRRPAPGMQSGEVRLERGRLEGQRAR